MRFLHVAVAVLKHDRVTALQHARRSGGERGSILSQPVAGPARLDTDQLDVAVA